MYDEPFTGQDPISMGILVQLIRRLNDAARITSVVVSHDVAETARIADLIYVISGGRVIESGSPEDLRERGGEWTRQFMQGLPDGPVPFHYPAPELDEDLFGGAR
jgi:phospholipid/cholesterol/gamma-HCH transport system ATP-binding protein